MMSTVSQPSNLSGTSVSWPALTVGASEEFLFIQIQRKSQVPLFKKEKLLHDLCVEGCY